MKGHVLQTVAALGGLTVAFAGGLGSAEAGKYCKGRHCDPYADEPGVYRYVYTESFIGRRRATAPVRHAPLGDQVQLPGGSWIYCEVTCEYTLRKNTVDFWDDQTRRTTSPGLLRYDFEVDTGRLHRRRYNY
jgi:hypothetical protein